MGIRGFILIALMISACRAGELACPDITVTKLKSTVIRPGQLKRGSAEEKFSTSTRYRPSDFKPRTDLKKAESIDEWDCPQPDKTRKDRKSTRLNSSHVKISYAVFCLKK